MKIVTVVGTRPNMMKLAPVLAAGHARQDLEFLVVHTGQHYDYKMSEVFIEDLKLPAPDIFLGVGSGSHAAQTARVMEKMEPVLLDEQPHMVMVFGDVNSTVAAALVAAKLCIPLAHVEAGMRSFDRSMPEEINRIVTDHLSQLLFATSGVAVQNLLKEGFQREQTCLVGDTMVDSLLRSRTLAAERPDSLNEIGVEAGQYGLVTVHRVDNVDVPSHLEEVVRLLIEVAKKANLVFPMHPRTAKCLKDNYLDDALKAVPAIHLIEPVGYLDMIKLIDNAAFVLSDSGGIQIETSVLDVPCLTLRDTTERPETLSLGTNRLIHRDTAAALEAVDQVLAGQWPKVRPAVLWDGKAAERIVDAIADYFSHSE